MTPGAFIPDRDTSFYLLARHRQPLAANVAQTYIEALSSPGDLVLDPFASSPAAAMAAVEMGRRAIAVDSNPIVAFAARLQATMPAPREIAVALERLGQVPRPDETLEAHIREQYASTCSRCGGPVTADYFIWSRDLHLPVEKVFHCPQCGPGREAATEADRARAAEIRPRGFHYHLLLERLSAAASPYYNLVRETLELYTPRNLYALVTITNKLEVASHGDRSGEVLLGCLLHALDVGTTLYPTLEGLPERKTPDTFVEVNVWHALEQAAAGLAGLGPALSLADSPEAVARAAAPALYIGHGSARALAQNLRGPAALVLTSPARLDPVFWELSYLWTRWLLGKNASHALEPLLDEERQSWRWYGNALSSALRETAGLVGEGGHIVAAFPAGSHAMVQALSMAAAPVLHLDSLAFRPHRGSVATTEFGALRGDYRMVWSLKETKPQPATMQECAVTIRKETLQGAAQVLAARAEPLGFSWLHHAAVRSMADSGTLAATLAAPMHPRDNAFLFLRREIEAGLKEGYARDLDHWQEPGRVLWLRHGGDGTPLVFRVEAAVREILEESRDIPQVELEDRLLARFPGLLTPEIELTEVCAAAFAELKDGRWRKRSDPADSFERGLALLADLGARLGYQVVPGNGPLELLWRDEKVIPGSSGGSLAEERVWEDSHRLVLLPHVDLPALLRQPAAPLRGLLILPETEVELTREKLRRLPTIARPLAKAGWEFLRLPFVERLLLSSGVTRANLQLALGLEPALEKGQEQMELF